jgi:hypothetical protein
MIVAIQLAFVSAAVAVSFVSAQVETTRCSTTLSNYYVETREEIFNQTVGLILSAFSSNDSATNASATTVLYSQLLERLNLTDTANRETAFNQAYDKILASATRTCSRLQGQEVQQSSIDQVQNELTTLLQSEDDMLSAIQSTYGTLLCYQGLTRSDQLGSFVDNLSSEDQAKIFGLSEGLYTLGFVVDDTGSMADEIAKVKQVIRFFVESDTAAPTHYILTSFNDPDVGVPKRYAATNPTEKSQLLSDVNVLYAHGGGDCPELGMTGIQNALGLSSSGGQLIVLTDASALDGHLTNSVISQASNLNVIIHFMYSHSSGCGSGYPYYDQVKNATGGFRLDDLNRFQDVAMILQNRSTAYNSISTSVNTPESGGSETDMADCKGIPVSSLSELLSVAINPQGGAARVSLTMPDDTVSFDETVSSFTVKDFSSPESGVWIVCVISGRAEIKQSQEVRFDITAEFLRQDESTGVYYTDAVPPHTRSEVTVLLFTMQKAKLSLSQSHKLKLVNEAGNAIAEVTLSLCESFLEGRYTLPTVRHRLFYEGFDTSNTTLIVDLGSFDAGPPPVSCVPSCKNGGTCIESNVCSCAQGYLGSDCSTQATCQPGCVHGVCTGVNICTCNFGYTGQSCDSVEFSPCVINTCLNNGTCMRNNLKDEVVCSCTPEYTGETCSKRSCEVVNLSSDQVLEIGGTVLNVALSETCELGLSDSIKCIFNGLEVDGTHMNGSAQCIVPVIGKVGKIPFKVRGSSDANGDFFYTSELASIGCYMGLSPIRGNMMGGTPVTVTLKEECVEFIDSMICTFDGQTVPAVTEANNPTHAFCTVPMMSSSGRIVFEFMVVVKNGGMISFYDNFFILPPYRAHEVQIQFNGDLGGLFIQNDLTIKWTDKQPVALDYAKPSVSFELFYFSLSEEKWTRLSIDSLEKPDTKDSSVRLSRFRTDLRNAMDSSSLFRVFPIAFQVKWTISDGLTSSFSYWSWSGTYFTTAAVLNKRGRRLLGSRSRCQIPRINKADIQALDNVPCPQTERQARLSTSGLQEELVVSTLASNMYSIHYYNYFYEGAKSCFVSEQNKTSGLTQQCCYNEEGTLSFRTGRPFIGTPLYVDKSGLVTYLQSTLRKIYCCIEGTNTKRCSALERLLSPSDGSGYKVPSPAFLYGDPHIVSLDGYQYTFNGKGEYVLLETTDKSLEFQGRMVPAKDENGTFIQATVFSAVAIRLSGSDTIQLEVENSSNITVLVNGDFIDFTAVTVQDFKEVRISERVNNTYLVIFTGGVTLEVRAENDFLSLIKISLPRSLNGRTRGLLGNFNGNPSDDLVPRNKTVLDSLPTNSSLEDIHNLFGITWIVPLGNDSLFTYRENGSFDEFHDPSFSPTFAPIFANVQLESEAEVICGSDPACLFDVAATGSVDIGLSTLTGSQELNDTAILGVIKVECNPPCQNGACIASNTCSCNPGYNGSLCNNPVHTSCDNRNPCQNGATCTQHVSSYLCDCSPLFSGSFCDQWVGVTGSPPRTVSYGGLLAGLIGGVSALALAGITGGLLAASFIRRRKRLLRLKRDLVESKSDSPLQYVSDPEKDSENGKLALFINENAF